MDNEVLIGLLAKYIDDRLSEIPNASTGPRGFRGAIGPEGPPGKPFSIAEHTDEIKSWIKEFSLKFSDLSEYEVQSLRGPQGLKGSDGRDGSDGTSFIYQEHEQEIRKIIVSEIQENSENFRLRFTDLTEEEKDDIRGPRGLKGKDGKSFVFEDHREFFESLKMKYTDLSKEEVESLKLKFVDLSETEKDSLKLKFKDLNDEDKYSLKGPRGQRGKIGPQGIQGDKGDTGGRGPTGLRGLPGPVGAIGRAGQNGVDGKDAPVVVDVEVQQRSDKSFALEFIFSDGSFIITKDITLPPTAINTYVVGGGYVGGGGGSGSGTPGLSAYEVAVANGFVGDETAWLASLQGATGADGADGLSAYQVAVAAGFVGNEAAWLASLVGSQGPQGPTGPSGSGSGTELIVDIPCETDVYVRAWVRLDKTSEVEAMMADWTSLFDVYTLSYTTYAAVAKNAVGDGIDNSNVLGLVESKSSSTLCTVRIAGLSAALFISLDAEDEYYLSPTVPGAMVGSGEYPTEVGQVILKLGQPFSRTQFIVQKGERSPVEI